SDLVAIRIVQIFYQRILAARESTLGICQDFIETLPDNCSNSDMEHLCPLRPSLIAEANIRNIYIGQDTGMIWIVDPQLIFRVAIGEYCMAACIVILTEANINWISRSHEFVLDH